MIKDRGQRMAHIIWVSLSEPYNKGAVYQKSILKAIPRRLKERNWMFHHWHSQGSIRNVSVQDFKGSKVADVKATDVVSA